MKKKSPRLTSLQRHLLRRQKFRVKSAKDDWLENINRDLGVKFEKGGSDETT
jgi:hypothetical protein